MKGNQTRGGLGRTVATFTIGATVGSILALLFAPASGRVTRQRLAQGVRKLQRVGLRKLGQTRRLIATRVGYAKDAATEWIHTHVTNGKQPVRHRA